MDTDSTRTFYKGFGNILNQNLGASLLKNGPTEALVIDKPRNSVLTETSDPFEENSTTYSLDLAENGVEKSTQLMKKEELSLKEDGISPSSPQATSNTSPVPRGDFAAFRPWTIKGNSSAIFPSDTDTRSRGYKTFSCSSQLSMKF